MHKPFDQIVQEIVRDRVPCIFVSPHIDDAMLSAGDLISYLSSRTKVEVINVFTKASPPPYTISARRFLSYCGYRNADVLFDDREKEDADVYGPLGIVPRHLGFVDGSFRRKKLASVFKKALASLIPEFGYIYPIFRLHIAASEKISPHDFSMLPEIQTKLKEITSAYGTCYVFCPLAVNTHLDHVVVRNVCALTFTDNLIYWRDFPYSLQRKTDPKIMKHMGVQEASWQNNMAHKKELVAHYTSQKRLLFPTGVITLVPELYYTK